MGDLFKKARRFKEPQRFKKYGLYPYFVPFSATIGPRTIIEGKETIMLGSNNYMGLTNHPEMLQAAKEAIDQFGTGCTGSRLLNGTMDLHNKLEKDLSDFLGYKDTIAFTTGFQVNTGIIGALTGPKDFVISDEKNHASIIDGCRLSKAKTVVYKHNDYHDLEAKLKELPPRAGKLLVTEGVFSIEGDMVPLKEIVEVAKQYDVKIMLDDAHGTGVLGEHGEGTPNHLKVKNENVDILSGTFSKSFASIGGFASGSEEVINYLKHTARSFLFSASMPPASVASAIKATELIRKGDYMRENVRRLLKRYRKGLVDLGFETVHSEAAIVPIVVGEQVKNFRLWRRLLDEGVYTNPYMEPAVPIGHELLRTSIIATHSEKDVDDALEIMERVGKELKIIE
ncbi:MAG: 8-amino-7-oxononanoate synthase [Promethearchaeia archaeon]|nr:MAG: 8-amino-7-oxononanoate synthase [Candidatus Lokiarchaeia archaeon]